MSKGWVAVRLDELLRLRAPDTAVVPTERYSFAGVYSFGRGVFRSQERAGSEFSYTALSRLTTDDFVYPKLMAWEGAFGVVPRACDGCYVSPEFPVFSIVKDKVFPHWLDLYFKIPRVWKSVSGGSTGTNVRRRRLYPDELLAHEIPLPSLKEQQGIVARIKDLVGKVEEARELRLSSMSQLDALGEGTSARLFTQLLSGKVQPLEKCVTLERGKFSHRPRNDPRFFGGTHPWIQIAEIEGSGKFIRSWSTTLNDAGLAISKKFPKGTVLISIAATIGAVGILDFDCCIPDSIVGVTPPGGMSSEFVYYYLSFLRSHLETIAPQSAQKNINLQILGTLPFPQIPLQHQLRIVAELDAIQAKLDAVKALQTQTTAELDAMMPAILDRAFKGEL